MQARCLFTTLLAVATVSSSCSVLGPSAAPVRPPPIDTQVNVDAAFPDDGLTRLIVTPIASSPPESANGSDRPAADAPSDDGAAEDGTSEDGTSEDGTDEGVDAVPTAGAPPVPADPSRVLTPEMMGSMPAGAVLEARDGKVGYLDLDGTFVAFDPVELPPPPPLETATDEESEPEPEPTVAPLYGNPYIDQLATDPSVENIIVVGDGTFGVELSDPSIIDPNVFSSQEDVPFAVTGDPAEQFQWQLENDGTNLQAVTGEDQVEDADLDVDLTVGVADGSGIVIAVIDSGVDFSHPDLENSSWSNLDETCDNGIDDDGNGYVDDCNGWDFINSDNEPFNPSANVHGTHVAGIITADRNGIGGAGIAPAARIMDLNVTYPNGSTSGASVTSAIRYAVDNGADVINMSLASKVGVSLQSVLGLRAAIDYAGLNGVMVVVAAGNNNVDIGSLAVYPASFSRANMLVVGASAANDTQATFSNYSATLVDLYAPGHQILSTVPGDDYLFRSGTSMAAPVVSAVAALVMETSPEADYELVIEQIMSTVDSVATLPASLAGGRVNAASALGLAEAPGIPGELEVSVVGLAGTGNDVAAEVLIATPPAVFDEEYRWELSLISATNVSDYTVVEHPFVVAGVETATGLTGALILGPSSITSVPLTTQLPDGRYSFIIEAVPLADGSSRLGDAFVTTFEVGDGLPAPGTETTTTTAAATTSTLPPSTEAPTTTTAAAGDEPIDDTAPTTVSTIATTVTTVATTIAETSTPEVTAANIDPGTPVTTAPITMAPTTTAPPPDPGAPSTAADPNVTAPAPTPPPTVPSEPPPLPPDLRTDVAEDGDWAVSSISPQAGYIDNANTVTIRGSYPISTYVWFGAQPGQVVYQSRDLITVRTPRTATPGLVDVSLRVTGVGTVLTLPDAYGYARWGDDVPEESDSGEGVARADGSATFDPLTNSGDEPPLTFRRSRMIVGTAVDIGNGLQGAAFSPNPTTDTTPCTDEPCVAVRN